MLFRSADLAKIPPEISKILAHIEEIEIYIAALKARRVELEQRGVESHWLTSMDYAVREEEKLIADRRTTIKTLETTRGLIESTPVVDCSTEKKIGHLPGWSAGIEAAYGDLKIPKKPYLSLEVGGNQRLGVVDHKRTEEVAAILVALVREFHMEGLPGLKIGSPHRQRWKTVAELFGYDLSIFSNNGSISTTTEGVGIPGTGDPGSTFPAGVFMADPLENDVVGIDYRHTSDYQSLSLGLDQESDYDCGTVKLGAGLNLSRLETMDTLSGSIPGFGPGFPFDFRYATDIESRNIGLFVKGGVEVPLDRMWDSQLRYAGEFSGFRLAAGFKSQVNFLSADGLDRLELMPVPPNFVFPIDSQRVRIAKDDTTFSYQLGASLKYVPPGVESLELTIGARYGESDTHPVVNRSGQTGERSQIEFETQEETFGSLGLNFSF